MSGPPTPPGQQTWVNWLPLPALILAADGSAVAANPAWASALAADGDRWLDAVEPPFRRVLEARLRLAVAASEPGRADCQVTGPRGSQWSRWWWHPVPPQNLVVCVDVIGDGQASAALPARSNTPDPPARAGGQDACGTRISADLATAAIGRIFEAGLALESAASLLEGPLASLAQHALEDLDQLVHHIRSAVFRQQTNSAPPPP